MKYGVDQVKAYRSWVMEGSLSAFEIAVGETDLYIRVSGAAEDLKEKAHAAVLRCRAIIEDFIGKHPEFQTTLIPYPLSDDMPAIIRQMVHAGFSAGVGPMAAVAGVVAEYVGRDLLRFTDEVIVENGGDIFLKVARPLKVGVYAGSSQFTGRLAIKIEPKDTPLGICTSSGTVGHSLSFGKSDATIAISHSTAMADACATAIGNLIKTKDDISACVEYAKGIKGIKGILIIKDDDIGIWGDVLVSS